MEDLKTSLDFIYELTQRFTGEFAVRPLLEYFPRQTIKEILKWSTDENVHVRRLSSEGMRLNLPWAKKSIVCLEEFNTYKKILTNLNADPSKFVQKSFGNNLNDLFKNYPEKAKEIIIEWKTKPLKKETEWIIKHGTRRVRGKNGVGHYIILRDFIFYIFSIIIFVTFVNGVV